MQHRQQGLAWCGGALGVVRRVRAMDRMGVTMFHLVISLPVFDVVGVLELLVVTVKAGLACC